MRFLRDLVAFLLANPVSDLVNPDCLVFHVSWNKNLKKIFVPYNYEGPGKHFLQHVFQSGTKFVKMERESETRFSYQSERSTF